MKRSVHSTVKCVDTLIQIAGKSFLGVTPNPCNIEEDDEIEIIDGPVMVKDSEDLMTEVVKVRHRNSRGKIHEGWIPYSFVTESTTEKLNPVREEPNAD